MGACVTETAGRSIPECAGGRASCLAAQLCSLTFSTFWLTLGCLFTSEAAKNGTKISRVAVESLSFYMQTSPTSTSDRQPTKRVFTRMFRTSDFPPFYFTYVKLILEMSFVLYISGFLSFRFTVAVKH